MSSIDYVARVQNACLTEDYLVDAVVKAFGYALRVVEKYDNTIYMEANSKNKKEFELYLTTYSINQKGVYESELIGKDYTYCQNLILSLDKESMEKETIASVVSFLLHIAEERMTEMLITSDIYDEICYICNGDKEWEQTFYANYEKML